MSDAQAAPVKLSKRKFDVRRDTLDFRDRMFVPTLVEVPAEVPLELYKKFGVPVLDQGQEGACSGFALATIANYLLRRRKRYPDKTPVSPRMFYEMARRYDEWPGEGYEGSSARGGMKGWHKHGVCSDELWPYLPHDTDLVLTHKRAAEAVTRPLGAYFRVNHKDLVAMHSALAEVGILYVTADVHQGWEQVGSRGFISFQFGSARVGSHAFAIVAYDKYGFWIQNSWGERWGKGGFARLSYDDWLENALDVWVARLGVPVVLHTNKSAAANTAPGTQQARGYSYFDLRPHILSLGNDGRLKPDGTYGTTEQSLAEIFEHTIPGLTKNWKKKRIFLYAHGGLVGESVIIQRIAEYRASLLGAQVFPLAFVWHSDLWSTITDLLQDAFHQRRPEGILESGLDFMLDRLDDTLEPLVRGLQTKILWDEMKENAHLATEDRQGGARLALQHLCNWMARDPSVEVHLVGHSAGSIFLAPFIQLLATGGEITTGRLTGEQGLGQRVSSCTLWAPGVTIQEFRETYLPVLQSGAVDHFALYTLTDEAEKDDNCANIYHKSLLYLVSNALENRRGEPLLGLAKYIEKDETLKDFFQSQPDQIAWIQAPNDAPEGSLWASKARHHGDFDDDPPTFQSTLKRVLETRLVPVEPLFRRSESSMRDRRQQLEKV